MTQATRSNRKTTGAATQLDEVRRCECGCNAVVAGGSRFRIGHDAKLKSELVKAAREGSERALAELRRLGWEKFAAPTQAMIRKAAKAKAVAEAEAEAGAESKRLYTEEQAAEVDRIIHEDETNAA